MAGLDRATQRFAQRANQKSVSYKSFHSGFVFSNNASFHARFQRLMLVSRWIAFT
jgi:hypothetical protein